MTGVPSVPPLILATASDLARNHGVAVTVIVDEKRDMQVVALFTDWIHVITDTQHIDSS